VFIVASPSSLVLFIVLEFHSSNVCQGKSNEKTEAVASVASMDAMDTQDIKVKVVDLYSAST